MTDFIRRRPLLSAVIAFLALIVLLGCFPIVPETKEAVVVRFGKPVAVVNRYQPRQDFGNTGAGVIARVPFVDEIEWIDKRVQSVDMEEQQVLSTDQLRLEVDAFARYRIIDPLRFYQSVNNVALANQRLASFTNSSLRNVLARSTRDAIGEDIEPRLRALLHLDDPKVKAE